MHWLLTAFTVGNFSVAFWPTLPVFPLFLPVVQIGLLPLLYWRPLRLPVMFLLGMAYGCAWAEWQLESRLPASLDRMEVRVFGRVVGLPQQDLRRNRFEFVVDAASNPATPGYSLVGKRLLLSWYGNHDLWPGQRLNFTLRLRSPRSFVNPGGLDYSLWLLRNGIAATGYVRRDWPTAAAEPTRRLHGISQWRHTLQQHISLLPFSNDALALLKALAIGDKSGVSGDAWRNLVRTGTVHLAVVSGLHIGLAATFGYWLGMGVGRLLLLLNLVPRAQGVAFITSFAVALAYSGLAGFGLPAQRALVMLGCLLLALASRRHASPLPGLLWSCCFVSVLDPLAVLSSGFWLSYGAVASLLYWFVPRPRSRGPSQWIAAQIVILFGLAGILLQVQHSVALAAPLINLLAVPWLGFFVVPLVLVASILETVLPTAAHWCWQASGWQLEYFLRFIDWAVKDDLAWQWQSPNPRSWWLLPALLLAAVLVLLPGRLGLRFAGLLLFTAVVVARGPSPPVFSVAVLDVGQGLAMVVRAGDKTLVYDTGPRYSSHFDAGSGIIAPYLRSQGIRAIDTLVISHGDADHAGGLAGLVSQFRPDRILSGALDLPGGQRAEPCFNGQYWRWQAVQFFMLGPGADAGSGNDGSCVLLIQAANQQVLLPGDIEADAERQLISRAMLRGPVTLLVAPHHGSKTSSSLPFVRSLTPEHVVYSAGFNHHFGHPHPLVRERYRDAGAREWSTADDGALRFQWNRAGELQVTAQRAVERHYWHAGRQGMTATGENNR